jgi:hypothetical protein
MKNTLKIILWIWLIFSPICLYFEECDLYKITLLLIEAISLSSLYIGYCIEDKKQK